VEKERTMANRNAKETRDLDQSKSGLGLARDVRMTTTAEGGYFSCKNEEGKGNRLTPFTPSEMDVSDDKKNLDHCNMDFVRRTVMSSRVQDVIRKVDLSGQSLLVAADMNDRHNLCCQTRALKSSMA
jgi:hypothetical protein